MNPGIPTTMAPWERALWEAQIGSWRSHYIVRDATGALVDEHDALNDIALDWATNRYVQRNIYTRGDQREIRFYAGHFEGNRLALEGERLIGIAWAVERRVILLNFRLKEGTVETFELITLIDENHRARVMQHLEAGRFARVTSVFGEERITLLCQQSMLVARPASERTASARQATLAPRDDRPYSGRADGHRPNDCGAPSAGAPVCPAGSAWGAPRGDAAAGRGQRAAVPLGEPRLSGWGRPGGSGREPTAGRCRCGGGAYGAGRWAAGAR